MTNEYQYLVDGKKQTVVARSKEEADKRLEACTRRKWYSKTIEFSYIGEVEKEPPNLPIETKKYIPIHLR